MVKNKQRDKASSFSYPPKASDMKQIFFNIGKLCLKCSFSLFHSSRGSLKADVKVLAIINSKTDTKAEAINHLIDGIHDALGKQLKDIFLLGRRLINIFKNRTSTLFI